MIKGNENAGSAHCARKFDPGRRKIVDPITSVGCIVFLIDSHDWLYHTHEYVSAKENTNNRLHGNTSPSAKAGAMFVSLLTTTLTDTPSSENAADVIVRL